MNNSAAFSTITMLCDRHLCPVPRHSFPPKGPLRPLAVAVHPPPPGPVTPGLRCAPVDLPVLDIPHRRNHATCDLCLASVPERAVNPRCSLSQCFPAPGVILLATRRSVEGHPGLSSPVTSAAADTHDHALLPAFRSRVFASGRVCGFVGLWVSPSSWARLSRNRQSCRLFVFPSVVGAFR